MSTPKLDQATLEQTRQALKQAASQTAAARALGISRSTLQHRLKLMPKEMPGQSAPARTVGRSLAEFRSSHDKAFIIPQKIRAGLAALGDGWEYEMAFAKLAGVSLGDLSAFRSIFEAHLVVVERTKRAWAGKASTAEKMRSMVS